MRRKKDINKWSIIKGKVAEVEIAVVKIGHSKFD